MLALPAGKFRTYSPKPFWRCLEEDKGASFFQGLRGRYRDSPGTTVKLVIEPSFASLAGFRGSNVLCCSFFLFFFFKEESRVHLRKKVVCYEFKVLSFRWTLYLYILVPAEVNFSRSREGRSQLPGEIRFPLSRAVRAWEGRIFFWILPSAGSGEQRPVSHSPVVYTLLSVLMSFLLIFLTSLLFVCSLPHLVL